MHTCGLGQVAWTECTRCWCVEGHVSKHGRAKNRPSRAVVKDRRPRADLICRRAVGKARRRKTAYISDRKCHTRAAHLTNDKYRRCGRHFISSYLNHRLIKLAAAATLDRPCARVLVENDRGKVPGAVHENCSRVGFRRQLQRCVCRRSFKACLQHRPMNCRLVNETITQ